MRAKFCECPQFLKLKASKNKDTVTVQGKS